MSTLAEIREKVIGSVKDDSGKLVNPDDYNAKIQAAIKRYSRHRPGIKVADIVGNGTHDYALPTGWNDEFSAIKSIEYPLGDVPATMLDNDEFEIYQSPTGKKIRLLNYALAATASFRVSFTILRTDATIPDMDVDALVTLAAALCCEDLANAFIQSSDSTIGADSVNYRSKAAEAASRGKRLMQLYKEHLGIKDDDITPAASAVVDLDMKYPGGGERLTHSRWGRKRR